MNVIQCRRLLIQRQIYFICILIVMAVCYLMYSHIIQCDEDAEKRLVRTPTGEYIPKYDRSIKVRSFGNLSSHCKYVDDKIDCPDVRHRGETMLRQAQLAILRMFKIVDLICTKHSIDYWLISGSLLGAYRDKMIIPWDDDGDIGMLNSDFERFSNIVQKELPSYLFFQDGTGEPEWLKANKAGLAKIRDRESCYAQCLGCNWHDGLQIDIFVFRKQVNPGKPIMLIDYSGRFHLHYDSVFPLSRLTWEDTVFPCPGNSADVLQGLYGSNYMKPPRKLCPEVVFIALPWYTCEYIKRLSSKEKKQVRTDSMVHDSLYFWFFG